MVSTIIKIRLCKAILSKVIKPNPDDMRSNNLQIKALTAASKVPGLGLRRLDDVRLNTSDLLHEGMHNQ